MTIFKSEIYNKFRWIMSGQEVPKKADSKSHEVFMQKFSLARYVQAL